METRNAMRVKLLIIRRNDTIKRGFLCPNSLKAHRYDSIDDKRVAAQNFLFTSKFFSNSRKMEQKHRRTSRFKCVGDKHERGREEYERE